MFKEKRVLVVLLVWLAGITGSALGQNTWKWLGYNYPKLNSTRLETIGISPNDDVFVGFDNDLIKLKNYENEQWIHCLSGAAYSITFNLQGDVFVGSDTCIYVSRDQGSHWSKMENTPKFNRIYEMVWGDKDNTLWVGDKKSVYVYANGSWSKVLEVEGKKSFARSPEGMFVGVYGNGLYYQRYGEEWTYTDVVEVFGNNARGADNYMADMLFFNGKLWMVTVKQDIYRFGGIVTYDGKFWKELRLYTSSTQLPNIESDSEYFTTLAVDSSGAIWFGSDVMPNGAYKLDSDGNWYNFKAGGHTLKYNSITCIVIDSQNRKWFGQGNITVLTESTTAVENRPTNTPNQFALYQNYPNPFNASTTISYRLARPGRVRLSIYDSRGRMVKRLVDEYQQSGVHRVRFNASNLPSGIYFYRFQTDKYSRTKKMSLIK